MRSVTVERDLAYATVGGATLGLDLYRATRRWSSICTAAAGAAAAERDAHAERLDPMAARG